ncbi:hypothetical protein Tco_1440057 [Tanacetum coccineum]
MNANKKFDLLNPQCPNESKILTNILLNHPPRPSIAGSTSVPWIYMYQFWHTLQQDGSRRREPEPKTPIPTAAEIDVTNLHETIQISIATQRSLGDFKPKHNVEKVQEHIVDEEIENLLEGNDNVNVDEFKNNILNNQEDPGTMIEPRSHKESMEVELDADLVHVNSNEEEEESAEETLIRRRCEKTFMPQKNFNELSEMLYQALKEMIPSMVNKEVKKIAKRAVPVYVAEGLLLERQKYKDDVVAMIFVAIRKER